MDEWRESTEIPRSQRTETLRNGWIGSVGPYQMLTAGWEEYRLKLSVQIVVRFTILVALWTPILLAGYRPPWGVWIFLAVYSVAEALAHIECLIRQRRALEIARDAVEKHQRFAHDSYHG